MKQETEQFDLCPLPIPPEQEGPEQFNVSVAPRKGNGRTGFLRVTVTNQFEPDSDEVMS